MLVVGHRKRGVSPEVRIACGGLDLRCLLFQEGDYSGGRLPVVAHFPVHEKFLIYSIDPVSVWIEVIVGVLEVDFSDQHQADGQSYTQGDNLHYIVLPSLKKGANCDPDVFHIVIVLFSGKIKSNTVPLCLYG